MYTDIRQTEGRQMGEDASCCNSQMLIDQK